MLNRRTFLQQSALLGIAAPFLSKMAWEPASPALEVHVFSKHLQFLNYADMAAAAADIGFSGVDLTVRPGGHVEPASVAQHLPQAIDAIRKKGLLSTLMVTAINHLRDPLNQTVLETAARQGIQHYRLGWYQYPAQTPLPEALEKMQKDMQALARLNKKLGIKGSYQNHSGLYVGASIWEVWELLEHTAPEVMGCQYDIRHAWVEGGQSWQTGLRLIQPRINTLAIKDFVWEKTAKGWQLINVPIGTGMVDFKTYFGLLKRYNIQVPVSLHFEYDLGGAEHGNKDLDEASKRKVYAAMRRDLERVQQLWKEA